MMENKEQRDRLAENGLKTFEEKYSVDKLAERFENLLYPTNKKMNLIVENLDEKIFYRKI
jgi:hypothetical protein